MPLYSTTAQNNALDAMWPDAAASPLIATATLDLGLLQDDPRVAGVLEVTGAGYARISVPNDGTLWNPASGGVKAAVLQTFGDSTGLWDTAEWWGIWPAAGAAEDLVDFGRLAEPIVVTAAGAGPAIRPRVRFNKELI